jgi:hypothetical protein
VRASLVCGEAGCPSAAVRAGYCERHQRRTVEGRPRLRRRARVAARDGERCFDCGSTTRPLIQSHDVPLVAGGDDVIESVHLRCPECHRLLDARFGITVAGSAAGEG